MARHRLLVASVAAAATVAASLLATGAPAALAAQPAPGHTALVPVTPRTNVAKITDGQVFDIETVGDRVYLAGTFTKITNPDGTVVAQPKLAAYFMSTGMVDTGFRPTFDSAVQTIEASPDGKALYVGGSFAVVNGVTKRKLVKLDPATAAVVPAFTANAGARVTALDVSTNWVYVGGQFTSVNGVARSALAAVNPTTGAVDAGFNHPITGGIGVGGLLTVQRLKLTHDDSKLLVVHTGRQVDGQDRYGVAVIDTATKALAPWRTTLWQDNLSLVGGVQRAIAADIAPDDSYFVVTSGSGGDRPPINDCVMAFPMAGGDGVQPLWVTRQFDSVYSVAITEKAVYVGGHYSWTESPWAPDPWPGLDSVGYGTGQGLSGYGLGNEVVRREQLAALNPADGHALEWNPGANGYSGVTAMMATTRGLFVGVDGTQIGGYNIGRHGWFDLAALPPASSTDTDILTPYDGLVLPANAAFDLTGTGTSPKGVKRVQLEIQRRTDKFYLQDDLTTWSATWNGIDASLAAPGAVSTAWKVTLNLPAMQVWVYAKAFGSDGSSDASKAFSKFETFDYENAAPQTAISSPPGGVLTSTTFLATGTAQDDQGVMKVFYYLRNPDTRMYLQADGSVSAGYNTFTVDVDNPGAPFSTWQTEITVPEGNWVLYASAIDNTGQADLRGASRNWSVTTTGAAPSVTITAPTAMTPPTKAAVVKVTPGSPMTFAGTATDDVDLRNVEVSLRNSTTGESLAADGTYGNDAVAGWYRVSPVDISGPTYGWTYTTTAPLAAGIYTFGVRATDDLGLTTVTTNQGVLTVNAQVPGDSPPNGQITYPATEPAQPAGTYQDINTLHLDPSGTATDDNGVAAVKLTLREQNTGRYLTSGGTMSSTYAQVDATLGTPGGTNTTWAFPVDLPTEGDWRLTVRAQDSAGQFDTDLNTGATAHYLVYPGDSDPTMVPSLATPADGASQAGAISLGGRATDDVGVSRVQVGILNAGGQWMSTTGTFSSAVNWIGAFLTSPGSLGSNFNYVSPGLPAGTYTVKVRAVDNRGQVQEVARIFTVKVT